MQRPEPPTTGSRAEAQVQIESNGKKIQSLSETIASTEEKLAQVINEYRCAIRALQKTKQELEDEVSLTLAYISPIRTLPHELLRHIFLLNFEDQPCCAWGIAAVCSLWRRLVLGMPRMWSKIRLVTTPYANADTIRLWLERSGSTIPLDIEIFLQVHTASSKATRRRSLSPARHTLLPPIGAQYVHIPPPPPIILPQNPFLTPPSPTLNPTDSPPSTPSTQSPVTPTMSTFSKTSLHWGHIAFYYMVDQMHRWERFIFRFDKQFASVTALKSVIGDAPHLKEFEISCAEPAFYSEWNWLPSAKANTTIVLPNLSSLTLQYMPFKWSSPLFKTDLHSLTLRSLPTSHLPLDRILHIVASNPNLESMDLHFPAIHPAILPLNPLTLENLTRMSLGGHYLLSQLLDNLTLPSLAYLSYNIEAREPIEETITNLISRSNNPPLATLSIAYHAGAALYYGAAACIMNWGFLMDVPELRTLKVGGTAFEPLLVALSAPEDGTGQWFCPKLTGLYMKGCHAHGDGVSKLVQMVDMRNPTPTSSTQTTNAGGGGGPVDKLKHLELHDCAVLGPDVVQWMKSRILEVVCVELASDRWVRFRS
ncbi:hypothetical protein BDM02DRAFT_3153761 [Thelephora ganbajun]|uniref:Uncharacterized protein n=1 Tax=Thelephora ganbajun TaxID=370292 RepID=A0ACB6ZRZ0_THEGA|nr:hypothetical protein BDM02DRAFT_3153761 [Thelephora ganbajun]